SSSFLSSAIINREKGDLQIYSFFSGFTKIMRVINKNHTNCDGDVEKKQRKSKIFMQMFINLRGKLYICRPISNSYPTSEF
ncbi:MAG: hypothetical protein K2K95_11345, partial [Muribaculaceae bacterium]|nr:hypothetical protein [Muribaculaceae bacterium]